MWYFNFLRFVIMILLLLLLLVYRLLFPRLCGSDVLPMMSHLHFSRSLAISGFNPMSFISPTNRAPQVILGLPLPLLPTTSIFLQALTQSSSAFRSTCPNHLNLPRLITSTIPSTPSLFLSSTVGTLSFNVTPHIHLNITFSFLCILWSHWHTPSHSAHMSCIPYLSASRVCPFWSATMQTHGTDPRP